MGQSRVTLYRSIRRGDFPLPLVMLNGTLRIPLRSIERLVAGDDLDDHRGAQREVGGASACPACGALRPGACLWRRSAGRMRTTSERAASMMRTTSASGGERTGPALSSNDQSGSSVSAAGSGRTLPLHLRASRQARWSTARTWQTLGPTTLWPSTSGRRARRRRGTGKRSAFSRWPPQCGSSPASGSATPCSGSGPANRSPSSLRSRR